MIIGTVYPDCTWKTEQERFSFQERIQMLSLKKILKVTIYLLCFQFWALLEVFIRTSRNKVLHHFVGAYKRKQPTEISEIGYVS